MYMENNKSMFKNKKEVLMYYHTTIRNVGLFTSVSLAGILGAYKIKTDSNSALRRPYIFLISLLSLAFMIMAIIVSYLLREDMKKARDELNLDSLNGWLILPNITLIVDIGLVFVIAAFMLTQI